MTTQKTETPNIHQLRACGQWAPDPSAHWRRLGHPELADEQTRRTFASQLGLNDDQLSLGSSFHRDYWRDSALSAYSTRKHNSKLHLHIHAVHRWMQTWSPLCFAGPSKFPENIYSAKSKSRYDAQMMADGWAVTIRLNASWRLRIGAFPEISPWTYIRDLASVGGWCPPEKATAITEQARLLCEAGKIHDSQTKLGELLSGTLKNPTDIYENLYSLVKTINKISEYVRDHRKELSQSSQSPLPRRSPRTYPNPPAKPAQPAPESVCCPPLLSSLSNRGESNRSKEHVAPVPPSESKRIDHSVRLTAQRACADDTARARVHARNAHTENTAKKPNRERHPSKKVEAEKGCLRKTIWTEELEHLAEELYWFSNNQTNRCILLAPRSDVAAEHWRMSYLVQHWRPVSRGEAKRIIEKLNESIGLSVDIMVDYLYRRFRKYYRYACHNQPMTITTLFKWLLCDSEDFAEHYAPAQVPLALSNSPTQLEGPAEELRRGLSAVRNPTGPPEYASDVDKFYNAFKCLSESGRWVEDTLSWLTTSPPAGVCDADSLEDAVDCVVEFLMDPHPSAPCLGIFTRYRKPKPKKTSLETNSNSWTELSPSAVWLFRWVSLTRRANWQRNPEPFSMELFEAASEALGERIGDVAFANSISLDWIGRLHKASSLDDALREVLVLSGVSLPCGGRGS